MMRFLLQISLALIFILKGAFGVFAQDIESLAIDFYNEGNYKKSIPLFKKLLDKYPDNDLINYYYGASLVHTNQFSDDLSEHFDLALEGDVPLDVHYLSGKNFHANDEFDLASQAYETYMNLEKKKIWKQTDVNVMLSLAYEQVNPFAKPKNDKATTSTPTPVKSQAGGIVLVNPGEKAQFSEKEGSLPEVKTPEAKASEAKASEEKASEEKASEEKASEEKAPEVKAPVVKTPEAKPSEVKAPEAKPSEVKVPEAVAPSKETISVVLASTGQKVEFNEIKDNKEVPLDNTVTKVGSSQEKEKLQNTEKAEFEFDHLQEGVEILFRINNSLQYTYSGQFRDVQAAKYFEEGWKAKLEREKLSSQADELRAQYAKENDFEKRNDIAKQILELEQQTFPLLRKEETSLSSAQDIEESFWITKSEEEMLAYAKAIDSIDEIVEIETNETPVIENVEETSEEVEAEIQEEELEKEQKVEKMPITDEVVYRIQIGAYRNDPPEYIQKQFKKLSMLRKINKHIDDKGVTVYTVGETNDYYTAVTIQNQVRQEGIKDAFVAAYLNGKRISINQARNKEKKK